MTTTKSSEIAIVTGLPQDNCSLGPQGCITRDDAVGVSESLGEISDLARNQANMRVLKIAYSEVIGRPLQQAAQISKFLGSDLDTNKMAGA